MSCSSKAPRPDKLLKKRLLLLSYSLMLLMFSVIAFIHYPKHFLIAVGCILFLSIYCLYLAIKTLEASEEAINYGGFANEILKTHLEGKRIDDSKGTPILQNDWAKEFLKNESIPDFLERHLSEQPQNKKAFQDLKLALQNLTSITVELSLFTPKDWFEVSLKPISLSKTELFESPFSVKKIQKDSYIFWNIKDITSYKNIEQSLSEERNSLHDFLDYLPSGLYICNGNYDLEYVNNDLAKSLNFSREELCTLNLKSLCTNNSFLPEKAEPYQGSIYLINKNNEVVECFIAQDTFRFNQEIKTRGIIISNLPTEKELQKDLNTAFDKISWLFNFSPIGIIFADKYGFIKDCNLTTQKFFKIKRENLIEQSLFSLCEDEEQKLAKEFQSPSEKISSIPIDVKIRFEKEERIASVFLSPMKSLHAANNEEVEGFVLYIIDSTKQKNLEIQFAQAQKMQAMGQLAGGVAHDFNNLLTAMIGFCDLLLQRHGVGDPSFTDLIQIKQNANRAAGLVRQLLAFSRKQPLKPKLIDVTENFVELSHMLKRILGEQIVLKFHHGNDLGFIRVDPVQFSQVIINLAVNAKDAMENNGILTISTHVETLTEPYQFGADLIKPGEFVIINVKDTGHGISKENLTRVFEPFFSTKQNVVGSGTGLGLSTVYGIVRQTEGFIKIDTKVDQGTTFSIYLPRFENNQDEIEEVTPNNKNVITDKDGAPVLTVQEKTSGITNIDQKLIFGLNLSSIDRGIENNKNNADIRILFVEDEDSVRTFGVRALKKKGYDVVGCNSAENALEHLKTDTNFDLLLTDMVMPGMSGAELAKLVKSQIKNIKVLLASGYSEEIARKELSNDDDFEFMAKPFSLGDLTKKVFDVLNS